MVKEDAANTFNLLFFSAPYRLFIRPVADGKTKAETNSKQRTSKHGGFGQDNESHVVTKENATYRYQETNAVKRWQLDI